MKEIPIDDPRPLFDHLDKTLAGLDQRLEAVVCGSMVVKLVWGRSLPTADIDLITRLEQNVKLAVIEAGEAMLGAEAGNAIYWLNDAVTSWRFDEKLPAGWLERAKNEDPLYEGKRLILRRLSDRDLALTKIYAIFTRGSAGVLKDVKDLKVMGLSSDEVLDLLPDAAKMLAAGGHNFDVDEMTAAVTSLWKSF